MCISSLLTFYSCGEHYWHPSFVQKSQYLLHIKHKLICEDFRYAIKWSNYTNTFNKYKPSTDGNRIKGTFPSTCLQMSSAVLCELLAPFCW
ncbi:hypothetical protein GDO78_020070 [Eleutherodactylus coqui]|uniref:Uncharacterized protein n=1 Tax=Eleutherodactylus coqui TaxID=57060 RepID=A0A8J6BIV9_ELECQ|nr:hypothetical protein GDO78_020070 [Eleutherodactylus coqui]